ncbi:uncharacterized protein LOC111602566 [Drosophila hydei]|uniref:Uncharacterized protein LOC111602566 n=1 Tax=Drosophila hydei TaxID=7224 RepID=A0A6J1MAA4_DROHY|nr:uncharacterized protein LOC111602566 [Drosophila hydei]
MDGGDRKISVKDEPMDETDQEKMLRETTNLLRQSENCMFTIQVAPGTTMHINISPELGLETDRANPLPAVAASWCISTLIIHNGQHYTNTIHNFTVSPQLINNLGLVREPTDGNVLQQLLMSPLDLPRNPMQTLSPRIVADGRFVHPTAIYRMVEHYCNYVMRTARILDNVFGWVVPQQNSELPALMQDIRFTSQTLQAMLERVQRSVQAAEQYFGPRQFAAKLEDDMQQLEHKTDEDDSSETDDDTEHDAESRNCAPEFVRYDDYDDSQIKCDADSTSSDSDIRSSIFLGPDFEEFPQQFWSLTSSEDDNEEEQGDEESWESDFGDDDSFDAYMVRQLRAHASGLATRLNADWVNLANEPTQADDDDEWDIGSCGTNGDIEDIRSELSYSSEDLNAWQYTEDRTFETELSRPFRRLVGDLPAQTAQEERYAWRHSLDHFEFRRSLRHSPNYRQYPDESVPFSFYNHWRQQENLATSSASSQSESPGRNQAGGPYSFSFYSNAMDNINNSLQPNISQLQDIDLDDLDQERETTPEPNSESDIDELHMDVDIDPIDMPPDQQIVPLQLFIQQTDELIAKIWANL